jgi:lipopolysaccharide biosynthesis glycosyltransferase
MEPASVLQESNSSSVNKGYELCIPTGMYSRDGAIQIAVAFDQNFITPFYVLLTSIFASNTENIFHFHIIAPGLTKEEKQQITDFIQKNKSALSYYEIPESLLDTDLPQSEAYPISIYYRLLFPFLVPDNIQQLLYIDTDIVVINNLAPLYQTDISLVPVGAVIEKYVGSKPELGIHEPGRYFNSGVLLMNIRQWKEQKITEKTLHYLKENSHKLRWMDQDALNAVLVNNYYPLDFKYNLTTEFIPKKLPRKGLQEFLNDKVIIHYTSGGSIKKPWSGLSRNRLRFIYHDYLKKSPHNSQKKYTDISYSFGYLIQFAKVRVFEFFIEHPVLLNLWLRTSNLFSKKEKARGSSTNAWTVTAQPVRDTKNQKHTVQ